MRGGVLLIHAAAAGLRWSLVSLFTVRGAVTHRAVCSSSSSIDIDSPLTDVAPAVVGVVVVVETLIVALPPAGCCGIPLLAHRLWGKLLLLTVDLITTLRREGGSANIEC